MKHKKAVTNFPHLQRSNNVFTLIWFSPKYKIRPGQILNMETLMLITEA